MANSPGIVIHPLILHFQRDGQVAFLPQEGTDSIRPLDMEENIIEKEEIISF